MWNAGFSRCFHGIQPAFPDRGLNQHRCLVNVHIEITTPRSAPPPPLPYNPQKQIRWQFPAARSDWFWPRWWEAMVEPAPGQRCSGERRGSPGPAARPAAPGPDAPPRGWKTRTAHAEPAARELPTAILFPRVPNVPEKSEHLVWVQLILPSRTARSFPSPLPAGFPLVPPDSSRRIYEENQSSALQGLNAVIHPYLTCWINTLKSLITAWSRSGGCFSPTHQQCFPYPHHLLPLKASALGVGVCKGFWWHWYVLIRPMLICSSSALAGTQPLRSYFKLLPCWIVEA